MQSSQSRVRDLGEMAPQSTSEPLTPEVLGMVDPVLQRKMAGHAGSVVVEHEGSHAIYISRPDVVVSIIQQAARSVAEGG